MMKRAQFITILLILLLFLITALWKSAVNGDSADPIQREDLTELRTFWEHHNRARDFLNHAVYDSAAFYYEKALNIKRDHEGVLYYLGSSRLFLRDYEEAREHWTRLAEMNPLSVRARLQLGGLYFCMTPDNTLYDPEIAESYFQEAHLMNREDTGPQLKMAKISILQNRLDKAESQINVVRSVNFLSYQALFLSAYFDWLDGDYASSGQTLQEAAELYENLTTTVIHGEGKTSRGARAMLAEDRFCDLFEIEIGRLLRGASVTLMDPELLFTHFQESITPWIMS